MNAQFRRSHRGLYECKSVFEPAEYRILFEAVANLKMDGKLSEEEAFEDHPPFCHMPEHILDIVLASLRRTDFETNFEKAGSILRSIISRYDYDAKHCMQLHRDQPNFNHGPVLSLVFSIHTPLCPCVSVELSNRNDGAVNYSMDPFYYESKDNTAYAFFGSEVAHAVKRPKSGTRFALILFFDTTYSFQEVKASWAIAPRGGLLCDFCFRESKDAKLYRQHIKKMHPEHWVPMKKGRKRKNE